MRVHRFDESVKREQHRGKHVTTSTVIEVRTLFFLFRLVPYVGEVSPRPEAATRTCAPSQTAQGARKGKVRDPCVSRPRLQRRPPENSSWPSSTIKTPIPPTLSRLSGWAGGKNLAGAPGLGRALNPKWHQINDFHTNQQARENFYSMS